MDKQTIQVVSSLVAAQELISQIDKLEENTRGIFVGNVKHHSEMTKEQQGAILAIYDINILLQNKISALSIFEQQRLLENFDYICNVIEIKEDDRN